MVLARERRPRSNGVSGRPVRPQPWLALPFTMVVVVVVVAVPFFSVRAAEPTVPSGEAVPGSDVGPDAGIVAVRPPILKDSRTTDVEAPDPADLADRISDLEHRLADSQEAVERRRPSVMLSGSVDFGFFAPQGNGSGIIQDVRSAQSRYFPEYADKYAWVFLGDLLAPAVNSRGEPASLGNLPGLDNTRQDTINSGGAPGFIVNEVNLNARSAVASNAVVTTSVNFLPRSGQEFRLGDFFDVDIAQLEWMPTVGRSWSIFVGKMESVLGIEYRDRKARDRFGITPSLLARYTTGTPLGVKVRGKLGRDDWLILAAAVTNGSSTTETFHFYDEVDSNAGKTVSARVALAALQDTVEVGVSASFGPQDYAQDSLDAMWFVGADLQVHRGNFDLKGQWLTGRAPGEAPNRVYGPNHRPYGLRLNGGAYLEADWMLLPYLGLLARGEYRDALVWLGNTQNPGGADRLYITKGLRVTGGARVVVNEHVALKVEYLLNREYGRVPQVRDDVFATSLVLSY